MKNYRVLALVILSLFTLVHLAHSQQLSPESFRHTGENYQIDQYGRVIKNGEQKFEYSKEDLKNIPEKVENASTGLRAPNSSMDSEIYCEAVWKQGVMGTCIGLNSMNSGDFDNDNKTEIICSGGGGFSGGKFWYILEYNENTTEYEFEWVSSYYGANYGETSLSTITYFDIENDGNWEILCGFTDGSVLIYDGASMDLIRTIESAADGINAIFLADADNDDEKEIVFCDDDNTYFFEITNYTLEHTINFGAHDFEPGNVDQNEDIELVYSNGDIISYDGITVSIIWDFSGGNSSQGKVELSDIDNDNMEEIIFARYWNNITVYDVDIQSPKYEIASGHDIDALLVTDVNNDGIDEILYGDGQWGDIYCHDAVTTQLMWSIDNPEHGTTEINVADVDDDGHLEVLWGSGCSSTGSDHLFIHEIPSCNFEWQSKHIDPPFYAVEIADVDDDGEIEIVTLSYESNSGYDSGIMTIFNSGDYSVEWQSSETFFQNVWTGMYNIQVEDIDGDGDTEIITAAGRTYTGQIWIINGASHEIESSHIFSSEDMDEFYALDVADVDGDGQMECVVAEDNYVHVIDPTDYSIEWSSVSLSGSTPKAIYIDNIDTDTNKEIVVCMGYIYIIDGVTHQQWQSSISNYNNIDIYDIDGDGRKDIVACSSQGAVVSIDGHTLQTTILFEEPEYEIDAVRIADISGNGEYDYVFTNKGSIFFRTQSGEEMSTQPFGYTAGKYNGLKLSDIDQNGEYEVFAGTNYIVVELNRDCYKCLGFDIELLGTIVSCDPGNDGTVEVIATGGEGPYSYLWGTGETSSQLTGLEAGIYSVLVTDDQGCEKTGEVTIEQASLSTDLYTQKVGCSGMDDGMAEVMVLQGNPPYDYNWSTGDTTQLINELSVGDYWVEITDEQNCTMLHNFSIVQDTLEYQLNTFDIECYGYYTGYAIVEIVNGVPPFTFLWSTGDTTNFISSIGAGDYNVIVTDDLACSHTTDFLIFEPEEFSAQNTSTPDDPETADGEGTATVFVTGGIPPYYYQWYDQYYQTNQTAINLTAGEYMVVIEDANNCTISQTVFVPYVNSINSFGIKKYIDVYPNPADNKIMVDFTFSDPEDVIVKLINSMGQQVIVKTYAARNQGNVEFDVSKLPSGLYYLQIKVSNHSASWKVQVL